MNSSMKVMMAFAIALAVVGCSLMSQQDVDAVPEGTAIDAAWVQSNASDTGFALNDGSFYLNEAISVDKPFTVSGTVTLDLNGKSLTYSGDGYLFTVAKGTVFTITDTAEGGSIVAGNGILQDAEGTSDSTVTNSKVTINGGSVKRSEDPGSPAAFKLSATELTLNRGISDFEIGGKYLELSGDAKAELGTSKVGKDIVVSLSGTSVLTLSASSLEISGDMSESATIINDKNKTNCFSDLHFEGTNGFTNSGTIHWLLDDTDQPPTIENTKNYLMYKADDGGLTLVKADVNGVTSFSKVTFGDESYAVTSIGENAFSGCTTVKTIDASGVVEVGAGAFSGCTSLSTLKLGDCEIAEGALTGTALEFVSIGGEYRPVNGGSVGTYTDENAPFRINDNRYLPTFSKVSEELKDGDTLHFLDDYTTTGMTFGKAVTIDLHGNTLTSTGFSKGFTISADVTIQNGTIVYDKSDDTTGTIAVDIKAGNSVTIIDVDLKISNTSASAQANNTGYVVRAGSTLVLQNGSTVTSSPTPEAYGSIGVVILGSGDLEDGTSVTLKDTSSIVVGQYGISGNGSVKDASGNGDDYGGTSIALGDSTRVEATYGWGVYHPQDGTLTISGSAEVQGLTGIEMRSGTLDMQGGTVKGTSGTFSSAANGNGPTTTGAAVAIVQHTSKQSISMGIHDGALEGPVAVYQADLQNNGADGGYDRIEMEIDGGTFTSTAADGKAVDVANIKGFVSGGTYGTEIPEDVLAPGFALSEDGEGNLTAVGLTEENANVSVTFGGSTIYRMTLEEAVAVIPEGQEATITILCDSLTVDGSVTIPEGVTVTLDMNGKTIAPADDFEGSLIINYGNLTVTGDGEFLDIDYSGYMTALNNYGTLTVKNGKFYGSPDSNSGLIWNREGGTAYFYNGHFEGAATVLATKATSTTYIYGGTYVNNWYPAIDNNGKMSITGGTFTNTSCSSCNGGSNWGYTIRNGNGSNTAHLTIGQDGAEDSLITVTGVQGGIASVGGTMEVYSGTFKTVDCQKNPSAHDASFYALYVAGEYINTAVTVYGGIFESFNRSTVHVGNSNDGGNQEAAAVVIKDGDFSIFDKASTAEIVYVDNKTKVMPDAEVSGGTFSKALSADVLADGFTCELNADGTYGAIQAPEPIITITPDATAPIGSSVTITATVTGAENPESVTYLWSTGASTASITVTESGTYTVTVSFTSYGIEYNQDLQCTVTFVDIALGADIVQDVADPYEGETVTLTAQVDWTGTEGTPAYIWSLDGVAVEGWTEASVEATESGTYTVTVTVSAYGETYTASASAELEFASTEGFGFADDGVELYPGFGAFALEFSAPEGASVTFASDSPWVLISDEGVLTWAGGETGGTEVTIAATVVIGSPDDPRLELEYSYSVSVLEEHSGIEAPEGSEQPVVSTVSEGIMDAVIGSLVESGHVPESDPADWAAMDVVLTGADGEPADGGTFLVPYSVFGAEPGLPYVFYVVHVPGGEPSQAYVLTEGDGLEVGETHVSVTVGDFSPFAFYAVPLETPEVEFGTSSVNTTVGAQFKPDIVWNGNVSFSSSDEGVATVGSDGTVIAVGVGVAVITATAELNGKTVSDTLQVTVSTSSEPGPDEPVNPPHQDEDPYVPPVPPTIVYPDTVHVNLDDGGIDTTSILACAAAACAAAIFAMFAVFEYRRR